MKPFVQRNHARRWALVGLALVVLAAPGAAHAGALEDAVDGLAASSDDKVVEAVNKLAALDDPHAIGVLDALCDDRLRVGADGHPYIWDSKIREVRRPVTNEIVKPAPSPLKEVEVSNEIRRVAFPVLAQLELGSPDADVRLAAATELSKGGSAEAPALLHKALLREKDRKVLEALKLAGARVDLQSTDPQARIAALQAISDSGNDDFLSALQQMVGNKDDGTPREANPQVRAAAQAAIRAVVSHQRMISFAGDLLHGLSLASVLLFAALGLAITFGLLGVINMAHGEMLMLGAYATYAVQTALHGHPLYLLLAIPVAFLATAAIGVVLERTVIRHLYGRPLETLLATWGISLGLIQTVRLLFGAQNVTVANPAWLSGGVEIAHGLVLPWSRIAVIAFVVVVSALVWFVLQRTRFGLQVRAVTQNRPMAACLGIPTRRVDALVFGLGSGIAGLGGVALSQLGNVGPELGQSYIIDSFMVVVLGGVGKLAGAVAAALGLGVVNKLLEPLAGAVLGKITVLVFIILFIQRRPQGLFALKGRVEA
ncbi:MAG TPA: urea ABC transporter permease subunit UrtB [Polyangia bacterium]|nr:urea ABC transporter permease subunit UrtB [Polyangia bacterium]